MNNYTVLVVDDDPMVYDFIQVMLEKQDVALFFAENGPTALEMAAELLPDLILLDVMLPGMDGFEICRRLRNNPILAEVPIVMITALDDRDSRLLGLQSGADDFLTKPVEQIELLTRVQAILRLNRYRKLMVERARFAEALETKNRQLRELTQHLIDVQETERRFIAAELHDDMGQMLTGLKLMIEMALTQTGDEPRQTLENARNIISELSIRLRNLSLDLRPAMLDDFGLFAALEWLFERFTGQTHIRVKHNFNFMNERRFAKPIETAAFRIIQESLTNVARYAGTDEVVVDIQSDGRLEIKICDHGKGFALASLESGARQSSGISGMRERVAWLGGEFLIVSVPGEGTTVSASFGLADEVAGG
jgi:signal transduction histidine kinase